MLSDIRNRGSHSFHQPEAPGAGVCLGLQLGQTLGHEEEVGQELDCHQAYKGIWGCPPQIHHLILGALGSSHPSLRC